MEFQKAFCKDRYKSMASDLYHWFAFEFRNVAVQILLSIQMCLWNNIHILGQNRPIGYRSVIIYCYQSSFSLGQNVLESWRCWVGPVDHLNLDQLTIFPRQCKYLSNEITRFYSELIYPNYFHYASNYPNMVIFHHCVTPENLLFSKVKPEKNC